MIDLHTHSTFSDGSLTPEELVARAREVGLTAMALTDHDSTGGVGRFMAACAAAGLDGIPGVEISADVKRGTLHMLGYLIDPREPTLQAALRRIREGRAERNAEILKKLNALGLALTWAEVLRHAGEEVVGRVHFAQAMVAKGHVTSKEAAFDRYLAKGSPAYASRFRFSPADSIAAIHAAGGLAVLSHPFTLELGRPALRECVTGLAAVGLDGIEAYYSEHTPVQTDEYRGLAAALNLVVTGGSDFHGTPNPAVALGSGFGPLRVPDELLVPLRARAAARR